MKRYSVFTILFLLIISGAYCEKVEDTLEMRIEIDPVFSLKVDTFMIPFDKIYSASELLKPSKNLIQPGKDLKGTIDLGYLIARKSRDGKILPLISEYQVLMKIYCETNTNRSYCVTQTLTEPLKGIASQEMFPESAFVAKAVIDNDIGQHLGDILIPEETPVISPEPLTIYQSGPTGNQYLGNVIDVYYWITDSQKDKVFTTQRADTYRSTLIITMVEL